MKIASFSLALAMAVGLAAPAFAQTTPPTDTGNMAYPAPLPQGNVGTTATQTLRPNDTGNMAYPAPLPQGQLGTRNTEGPNRPTDVGNMAQPAPRGGQNTPVR